jgi:hypothetical protein
MELIFTALFCSFVSVLFQFGEMFDLRRDRRRSTERRF